MRVPMVSRAGGLGLAMAAGFLISSSAAGDGEAPKPEHAVPGWYLGMPVMLAVNRPEGDVDRRSLPSMPVYVTAPVTPTSGSSPERTVVRPDGEVFLPAHQDIMTTMADPESPILAIGYFVEIGPKGTPETVRTLDQPDDAWPSKPLASHIRMGTEWIGLNNHLVIEYGLRMGLLQAEFFDVGGLMWAFHFDGGDQAPAIERCAFEQDVALPEVDWEGDVDHMPGEEE